MAIITRMLERNPEESHSPCFWNVLVTVEMELSKTRRIFCYKSQRPWAWRGEFVLCKEYGKYFLTASGFNFSFFLWKAISFSCYKLPFFIELWKSSSDAVKFYCQKAEDKWGINTSLYSLEPSLHKMDFTLYKHLFHQHWKWVKVCVGGMYQETLTHGKNSRSWYVLSLFSGFELPQFSHRNWSA